MKISAAWAYPAVFVGVCGHASSEFFAVLSGVAGPEASVWRYLLGGLGLVIWTQFYRESRDLITPLQRVEPGEALVLQHDDRVRERRLPRQQILLRRILVPWHIPESIRQRHH